MGSAPVKFTIENNNLSPRLSVAWDPWGSGKTKLFSTWGRYFDNIFMEAVVQEEAPAFVSRNYRYDYDHLWLCKPVPIWTDRHS